MVAVLATIGSGAFAHGAQNSDFCDLDDFGELVAILMTGDVPDTTSLIDFKLQQATTAAGAGVKDITGKAITQILSGSPAADDKQAVIDLRADELDIDNGFRFVRAVATIVATSAWAAVPVNTIDYGAVLIGRCARH